MVVALDARGFVLGGAIAYNLSLPFVPIRKQGKLPGRKHNTFLGKANGSLNGENRQTCTR